MKILTKVFFASFLLCLLGCAARTKAPQSSFPVKHDQWERLLQSHVTPEGWVDYKGFIEDSALLNQYLDLLSSAHPNDKHWSKHEQLTYWINAYNAFTVRLIIRHYPVESIKKVTWTVPLLNSPWKINFISIQGITYNLGNIEHDILRKKFAEPRIHFAINCASYSCPPLSNHAYTADSIDDQLQRAAIRFVNDPLRNRITTDKVKVSSIFLWFRGDFTKDGSLHDFLNQYSRTKIRPDQHIGYLKYDWSLNDLRE